MGRPQRSIRAPKAAKAGNTVAEMGAGASPDASLGASHIFPGDTNSTNSADDTAYLGMTSRELAVSAHNQRQAELTTVDDAFNPAIESLAGDMGELQKALAISTSPKNQKLLSLLTDPRHAQKSVTRLCRMAGVNALELYDALREQHTKEALLVVAKGMPVVTADLVQDSRSKKVECERCDGWGKRKNPHTEQMEDCKTCGGTGLVIAEGSTDARKLLLETAGFVRKQQGPLVNLNMGAVSNLDSVLNNIPPVQNQPSEGQIIEVSPYD